MCSPGRKGHDDLTSSLPSSDLHRQSSQSPQLNDGNWEQGLRSLLDLTKHLTTRADDNHAPPVSTITIPLSLESCIGCQVLVRFFVLRRIKPHAPPLVRAPVNSFKFHSCERTSQAEYLMCLLQHWISPTLSTHRLQRGLLGYLILFATHAFVTQRQSRSSKPPSPLVFLHISAHFTATHGIPLTSSVL